MAAKGTRLSAESRAKITGRPISETAGVGAIHRWLRRHHPKTGRCEHCGGVGKTDLAFLHHPESHTRNREDYLELCRKCHRKMDDPIYGWSEQIKTIATTESCRAGQRASTLIRFGLLLYLGTMCCARYRTKDETDLVWNRTRRRITRDLDTKIQDFREELLNRMLTGAWEKYVAALESGSLVQLEDEATEWVDNLLKTQLLPAIEAADADMANG